MDISGWVAQNWFDLFQTVGIIASLVFTGIALRHETKARRVDNLLAITENHRSIWNKLYERPELSRVLDESVDIRRQVIAREEEIFVNSVIFHLNSVFYALNYGLAFRLEGLQQDVGWFLSLPIPSAIWEKTKTLQNDDFVAFVEWCRGGK